MILPGLGRGKKCMRRFEGFSCAGPGPCPGRGREGGNDVEVAAAAEEEEGEEPWWWWWCRSNFGSRPKGR